MGCICAKGASDDDGEVKYKEKSTKFLRKLFSSSIYAKVKSPAEVENEDDEANSWLVATEVMDRISGSSPNLWEDKDKQQLVLFENPLDRHLQPFEKMEPGHQFYISRDLDVNNGIDGAYVVAGWPSWLTAVAGEAIQGWVPQKSENFEKLEKIGQGTYSSVYKARDCATGKIVALKKVRFFNMDPESVRFMAREILILRRLNHPNVMKLEGLVTSRVSTNLYLVFEYMEHDLAGLANSPAVTFTESQIKCYMKQLLHGLEHCHSRGVLHRDVKSSNLLLDNNGNLKIGDFGLATIFGASQKKPLTSRVVTLWYRPPELLLGATDYGIAVDLWSSGCILAELFAGKPIMPGRTEVEQLHKIFKLCGSPSEEYWTKSRLPHATIFKPQQPYERRVAATFQNFPNSALTLLESLLAFEPECRGSTSSALHSEFFLTEPLPCDPSSLPKYPPSKEFDALSMHEELKSHGNGYGLESFQLVSKDLKHVSRPDFRAPLKRLKRKLNPKSNTGTDGVSSGFPVKHWKGSQQVQLRNQIQSWENSDAMNKSQPRRLNSSISFNYQGLHSRQTVGAASLSPLSSSDVASSNSVVVFGREASSDLHNHEIYYDARSELMDGSESSHSFLTSPKFSYNNSGNNKHIYTKKALMLQGNARKKEPIPYSGPLLIGSMEEMIREHERKMQIAVRKARRENDQPRQ